MGKTENTVEPEFLKQQTAVLEQHNHTLSTTSKQIAKQSKQVRKIKNIFYCVVWVM